MAEIIKEIADIIKPFKHGKLGLLDRLDEINFSQDNDSIKIENWVDYTPENNYGDCVELAVKAYRAIKKEFPDLNLNLVWGFDGVYFNEMVGLHSFLMSDISGEMYVIDPSFKVVDNFLDSGYFPVNPEPHEWVQEKLNKGKFEIYLNPRGVGLMLGVDSNTKIINYLTRNHDPTFGDVFAVNTYRNAQKDAPEEIKMIMPVERMSFPISPAPQEVRDQVPYLNLAYKLEMKAEADLRK